MKIIKSEAVLHDEIKAPDATEINDIEYHACVLEDGRLLVVYREPQDGADKVLIVIFNRYESQAIRAALAKRV